MTYTTRAAQDAIRIYERGSKFCTPAYADYIEQSTLEDMRKFPDRAEYFKTRTLGEALQGNDGD